MIISIEYNHNSQVYCYNNLVQYPIHTISSAPFVDTINTKAFVGCSSNAFNCYNGFIYKINIYRALPELTTLASLNCESCGLCFSDHSCLPTCSITQYMAESCKDCSTTCVSGCRNSKTCNLCKDPNCYNCSTFEENSCIECIPPFTLLNNLCLNCKSSEYYDNSTNSCLPCSDPCLECKSAVSCTKCFGNSTLSNETCVCEKGFE